MIVGLLAAASVVIPSTGFAAPEEPFSTAGVASSSPPKAGTSKLQGECVYQCWTDMDCSTGKKCIDTTCGRVCETPCAECTTDQECGPLHECVSYRCGKQCDVACPNAATTTATINQLLTTLTPTLNEVWPKFATKEGLDPMASVYTGDINLGCKNGGDELCLTTVVYPLCKKFYAHVKVTDLTGLSKLQFSSLAVTGLSTSEGAHSCAYGDAPYSGNFLCSYQGTGTGKASLPSDKWLGVSVPEIKIKTKCAADILGVTQTTETFVRWSGSATCHAKKPSGTAEFGWCGGSCTSRNPAEVLASAEMTKLKLAVQDLSCDVKGDWFGDANSLAWISEILVPEMKDDVAKALEGPIMRVLNDVIEDIVPFPDVCK